MSPSALRAPHLPTHLPAAARAGLLCVVAALLAGCPPTGEIQNVCAADGDCPRGFVCLDGQCRCGSDAACAENELCNVAGFCQRRIGCESSLDCETGFFCDLTTRTCLPLDKCTADVQCALGEVCDPLRFTCIPGCHDRGDCPLGAVCECPGDTSCTLKQCRVGPCGDNSYCRYGEVCRADGEDEDKRCQKDERGPFCEPCEVSPGRNYCGEEPRNFCLVDTSKQFASYFCGVTCEDDDQCPWGFECSDVLILTQDICGGGDAVECPVQPERECLVDDDCAERGRYCNTATGRCECQASSDCAGGVCDEATKRCQSICVGGEGQFGGFCTCLVDGDCPTETCDPFTNACSLSGKSCDPDAVKPCGSVYCKHVANPTRPGESIGYCYIGNNCAPVEGVTCDVVRAQR